MILIQLDKSKKKLYQQIYNQIVELIKSGSLHVGETLPSTRKLAELTGVNRTTVYRAYQELWAAGYIESTEGGYSKVRQAVERTEGIKEESSEILNWNNQFSDLASSLLEDSDFSSEAKLNFRLLSPDHMLMPVQAFRQSINRVLQEKGSEVLDYNQSEGYYPLREYIARQMQQHGIHCESEQIMMTNGMQNGLELLTRTLANPRDIILCENPTYGIMLQLAKHLGIRVHGVSMIREGMDLSELESKIIEYKPKFIYTIPTFHNPTGITTSYSHREKFYAICKKYKVPILEDGFEEDMKYFGKAIVPIKSMDKNNLVIYLGTFSKVLFPGIRVGWFVAPKEVVAKAANLKRIFELSSVTLTQAAILDFCKNGNYDLHKKRLHRSYKKRMQVALQACRKYLPLDKVSYTKPNGGYLIWFSLKIESCNEEGFIGILLKNGVAVSPGRRFFVSDTNQVCFRLSISSRSEEEIEEGIKVIGNTVNSL
ncbi:MocR-like pyridoxine biosynthesis transcription factor PdxR [Labilibacter marinus]|uniref:MocR-like pyridoxine biosynthesis transcription factor PdxR n=1 Tax=Labilibacter marinus TaxID=1477105 RepID=UPI00082A70AD|nr:PLP-dependent aminotransferase family protein [Labilibacter marinus]